MEDNNKLTLTLRCLDGSGSIRHRAVSLDSEKYWIPVGRSSKVETKNLVAAHDNLWFDNPVLSRNHAEFIVIPGQEEAYLVDTRSLHGTWINGVKLSGERRVLLEDGDLVTFGAKVARGTEVHEPLRAQIGLQWEVTGRQTNELANGPSIHFGHRTKTFTVPEDDESELEDEDQDMSGFAEPAVQHASSSNAASEVGSLTSSCNENVADSPITSPFHHSTQARSVSVEKSAGSNEIETERQRLIRTRCEMLENCYIGKSIHGKQSGGSELDGSISDDLYESDSESAISSKQGSVMSEPVEQRQEKRDEIPETQASSSANHNEPTTEETLNLLAGVGFLSTPESMHREPDAAHNELQLPCLSRSTNEPPTLAPWPMTADDFQQPDRRSPKPTGTEFNRIANCINEKIKRLEEGAGAASSSKPLFSTCTGWAAWPSEAPVNPRKEPTKTYYNDGPFLGVSPATISPNDVPNNAQYWVEGVSPMKSGPRPMVGYAPVDKLTPMAPETRSAWDEEYENGLLSRNPPKAADSHRARNIIDSGAAFSVWDGRRVEGARKDQAKGPSKRKLDEADLWEAVNANPILDAVEREKASEPVKHDFQPVVTEPVTIQNPETSEKPRKRAKTTEERPSRMRTLARYAATAVAGAVAGSVGAIVALASLPPDFFN